MILWVVVGGCGWFWVGLGNDLRVIVGGCGWLQVVVSCCG